MKKKIKQKKIGLTLGGGGARGFAHIGVYEVLLKHKIPIDFIAGCSMGSVIGAGMAQGIPPKELLKIASKFPGHEAVSFKNVNVSKGSILSGKMTLKTLKDIIPKNLTFKDLKIKFHVNAVNIESGEQKVFKTGNVLDAVRASSALPGIYPPAFIDGSLYIDGGVLNAIPVDLCKKMGANIIIAVDLKSYISQQNMAGLIYHFYVQKHKEYNFGLKTKKNLLKELKLKLMFPINIMMRSIGIAERKGAEAILAKIKPQFILHPKVDKFGLLDFESYMEIYEEGKKVTEKIIPEIKKALS